MKIQLAILIVSLSWSAAIGSPVRNGVKAGRGTTQKSYEREESAETIGLKSGECLQAAIRALSNNNAVTARKEYERGRNLILQSGLPSLPKSELEKNYCLQAPMILFHCARSPHELVKELCADQISLAERTKDCSIISDQMLMLSSRALLMPMPVLIDCAKAYSDCVIKLRCGAEQSGKASALLGWSYESSKQYALAEKALSRAIATGFAPGPGGESVKDTKRLQLSLADCLVHLGRFQESAKILKVLCSDQTIADATTKAIAYHFLAESQLATKGFAAAERSAKQSLDWFEKTQFADGFGGPMEYSWCFGNSKPTAQTTLSLLISIYNQSGKPEEAMKIGAVKESLVRAGRTRASQDAYSEEGKALYEGFGKGLETAQKSYSRLLELGTGMYESKPADFASFLNALGIRCIIANLYPQAEKTLLTAQKLAKSSEATDPREYGKVLSNLGRYYVAVGAYGDAEPLLNEAMQLRVRDYNGSAISKGWLGRLYLRQEKYPLAEKILTETLDYRAERRKLGPKFIESADNLIDLAIAKVALKKPLEAIPLLRNAIEIRNGESRDARTPFEYSTAKPLSVLAVAQASLQGPEDGSNEIDKALAEASSLQAPNSEIADVFDFASRYYALKRKNQQAIEYGRRALEMRIALYGSDSAIVRLSNKWLEELHGER